MKNPLEAINWPQKNRSIGPICGRTETRAIARGSFSRPTTMNWPKSSTPNRCVIPRTKSRNSLSGSIALFRFAGSRSATSSRDRGSRRLAPNSWLRCSVPPETSALRISSSAGPGSSGLAQTCIESNLPVDDQSGATLRVTTFWLSDEREMRSMT